MNNYDEFQQSIIGALLLFDDIRPLLLGKLRKSDFTDEPAKEAFEEISANPQADRVAIIGRLSDETKQYVLCGCENAPMHSNAEATVNSFVEQATQKWLLSQTQSLAFSPTVSASELKGLAEQAEKRTEIVTDNSEKYLQEFYKEFETVPTGFERLDNLLCGGFVEGTIAAIGARPSTGKTTFAINILKACLDSQSVFFSLEMSGRMIYDRIMADNLEIEYGRVHKHRLDKTELEMYIKNNEDKFKESKIKTKDILEFLNIFRTNSDKTDEKNQRITNDDGSYSLIYQEIKVEKIKTKSRNSKNENTTKDFFTNFKNLRKYTVSIKQNYGPDGNLLNTA